MCAFIVVGLVFFHTKLRAWLGERIQNDMFCVKWDLKPQLNQSLNSGDMASICLSCHGTSV